VGDFFSTIRIGSTRFIGASDIATPGGQSFLGPPLDNSDRGLPERVGGQVRAHHPFREGRSISKF
jgi:hypothetical protein